MSNWDIVKIFSAFKGLSILIANNKFAIDNQDISSENLVIDSRKLDKSSIFLAIKGENHDGNNFLQEVIDKGCKIAIISDSAIFKKFYDIDIALFLVTDGLQALNQLAIYQRSLADNIKIIAITGSVGKTTTKEILKLALSPFGKTYATSGNLNNHIGLPLTICNMPLDSDFAILEMGMNHFNEIRPLSMMARPHLAIITNIGTAHLENFANQEEIAIAKSEIFDGLHNNQLEFSKILINYDSQFYQTLYNRALSYKSKLKDLEILNFGHQESAIFQIKNIDIESYQSCIVNVNINYQSEQKIVNFKLTTIAKSVVENSIIALATLELFNLDLKKGLKELEKFKPAIGRGGIIEINNDKYSKLLIIDDSYNSSLSSIKAGLEFARIIKSELQKRRLIIAIGDMLELGSKSDEIHLEAIELAINSEPDLILLIGERMNSNSNIAINKIGQKILQFPDSQSAAKEIDKILQSDDLLYVKGSRGIKMENIYIKI